MGGCNRQERCQSTRYYVCCKLEVCAKCLQVAMQVLESKCTTHDQALFLPLIPVILSCSLCFHVLHLYCTFILGFLEAMAPLQVLNFFKFKLFFNDEQNVISNSFPHVNLMYK